MDENLSGKEHIKYNENKIAKNLKFLYKAKHYLNKRSLLVLYYSFIHTYINYGNIALGSTNRINLKRINSLQKHAIRIRHCKDRLAYARELFRENNKFCKPTHKYTTNFSTTNYSTIPPFKLRKSKYRISIRGPTLWTNIPTNSEKM